ncbi:MAG: nicotinate-nucleotide adenylyltransferase [Flavobacteriaceae bacterium]|nr:nicotinate-nucleotide adenylyltransferase [Flavobacteriaceae bacterium]
MKKLLLILFIVGLGNSLYAQDPIWLEEVFISATNYKYLSAVDNSEAPIPVKQLEKEAAMFRAEGRDPYVDRFNTYEVSFYVPNGRIVALYDGDGKIIKTIERFENVQLPESVMMALRDRFPQWGVVKDIYKVNYSAKKGAEKVFKVKLKNGDETIRVQLDEKGNFI